MCSKQQLNVTSTEEPTIGMYRFSCFTAFEYTISQNHGM